MVWRYGGWQLSPHVPRSQRERILRTDDDNTEFQVFFNWKFKISKCKYVTFATTATGNI